MHATRSIEKTICKEYFCELYMFTVSRMCEVNSKIIYRPTYKLNVLTINYSLILQCSELNLVKNSTSTVDLTLLMHAMHGHVT